MFEITPGKEPLCSLLERWGMHLRTLRVRLSLRVIQSNPQEGLVIHLASPFFCSLFIMSSLSCSHFPRERLRCCSVWGEGYIRLITETFDGV